MQQFISNYGYLAIFILMLAESACIPVPSELTMLFAGALSAGAVAGAHLNLVLAITAGVAGNVAGSYLAWGIGIYGGRAAWHRWGRYILLRDDDIDRAERWFGRHGTKAVFFGRLLPVVRTFISLPAGLARMPAGRFGIYTVLGCIPWTAALACDRLPGRQELGQRGERAARPQLRAGRPVRPAGDLRDRHAAAPPPPRAR